MFFKQGIAQKLIRTKEVPAGLADGAGGGLFPNAAGGGAGVVEVETASNC